jgi:acetyl-CoA carboxylase biotin carboxyl carrier protein
MSDTPDLTPEDVKEILRLVDESRFDEFELETPRFTIRFRRGGEEAPPLSGEAVTGELIDVVSPMVGTFYRASAPGEASFVEVGSHVGEETQVCIIEVMKLMSSVAAGARGVVVEVCRGNGEAVQYGDVLFRLRPE